MKMQLASIVVTTLAVIAALWKERFIAWLYPPKLTVEARQHPPDVDLIPFRYPMPGTPTGFPLLYLEADCYFLRLWIQNDGKTRAEKVQVFVSKILRERVDGEPVPLESFIPMNLRWGFGSETLTHAEVFADGISPDMGVHCNLAQIIDPGKRIDAGDDPPDAKPGETVMRLTTEMNPTNRCNVLTPGTYQLKLLVAGSNCRPKAHTVQITISGKWFKEREKMLQDGVIMKKIDNENKRLTPYLKRLSRLGSSASNGLRRVVARWFR